MQVCMNGLVSNPFHFGALALDEAFTDREQERAELTSDIRNGQDVVVIARRRLGKSSLAWSAAQAVAADGVLVAQVDLMTTPTKERLAAALAGSIFEQIASTLERVKEAALAPFRGLQIQPTVTVDPGDGSYSFSFAANERPEDIDATLERLFRLPGELAAARGRRAALVMDEFQQVDDIDRLAPRDRVAVDDRDRLADFVARLFDARRRHDDLVAARAVGGLRKSRRGYSQCQQGYGRKFQHGRPPHAGNEGGACRRTRDRPMLAAQAA